MDKASALLAREPLACRWVQEGKFAGGAQAHFHFLRATRVRLPEVDLLPGRPLGHFRLRWATSKSGSGLFRSAGELSLPLYMEISGGSPACLARARGSTTHPHVVRAVVRVLVVAAGAFRCLPQRRAYVAEVVVALVAALERAFLWPQPLVFAPSKEAAR